MSKKKVKAPLTHNPGKGRPKEHLAYLNEREMAFLRMLNGGNMERGPRGLPSFAEDRPAGPGGPNGPNSGPSQSGGGGGLGGGGKGAGGTAGGAQASSSSAASTAAASSASSATKAPASPMSGQGTSFSSPKAASTYNADSFVQQKAQVNAARSTVANTPAARNDLAAGGIRSLSVGPMGTKVNVGPRISPSASAGSVMGMQPRGPSLSQVISRDPISYGGPRAGTATPSSPPMSMRSYDDPLGTMAQARSIRDRIEAVQSRPAKMQDRVPTTPVRSPSSPVAPGMKYSSPLTPGYTQEDLALRNSILNRYEQEVRDLMRGEPTKTGDPISAGGGRPTSKTRGIGSSLSAPKAEMSVEDMINALTPKPGSVAVPRDAVAPKSTYSGASFNPESAIQQAAIDRAISESIIARDLGVQPSPAAAGIGSILTTPAAAAVPGSVDLRGAGYGTFNVPDIRTEQPSVPDRVDLNDVYGPPLPEERILEIEDVPEEVTRIAAGTYTTPYDVRRPSAVPKTYSDMLSRTSAGSKFQSPPSADFGDVYDPEAEFSEQTRIPSWAQGDVRDGTRSIGEAENTVVEGVPEGTYGPETPDYDYVGPAPTVAGRSKNPMQDDWGDIQREETLIDKMGDYAPGIPGLLGRLIGKAEDMRWGNLSPEERLAQQEKWDNAAKDYLTSLGTDNDRGPDRRYFTPPKAVKAATSTGAPKETGRPQIYYNWDAGVGIPSPGDSDYTLYLKYLEEKAAAEAAV